MKMSIGLSLVLAGMYMAIGLIPALVFGVEWGILSELLVIGWTIAYWNLSR